MRDVGALETQQRVVESAVDDAAGRLELPLRVGRLQIERLVDDERAAGGRGLTRGGCRCDDDEHDERGDA